MESYPFTEALTLEGAADFLGRNFNTFRASYKRLGVPCIYLASKPLFFKADLLEWNRKNPRLMERREAKYESAAQ